MPARPTVASLIPSGTDIVAALGHADALVGVSHSCDHPAAEGLPVLTRSTVPAAGSPQAAAPGEVDSAVVGAVTAGRALYEADTDRLAELAPDVVLSQDVCDVCAVPGSDAAAGVPEGARLVMLTATTIAELEGDLVAVGEAIGNVEAARRVWGATRDRIDEVRAAVRGAPRPRVLSIEWTDPPFVGGHWVPELVEAAGGEHLLSSAGEASRRLGWSDVAEADPDVILSLPCGYGLATAAAETQERLADSPLGETRAARNGAVWALDATRLTSRCTPTVADAAATVARILHPGLAGEPDPHDAVRVEPTPATT